MLELVKATYNETAGSFTEDAWFNATVAADRFGKRLDHWIENQETKNYIAALCEISNTPKEGYLKTRRGRNGGTWLHPDLAVAFARWLDIRFGIWCDQQIKQILKGTHQHHDWKRIRSEASSSFKVMNAVLQLQRQTQGKATAPHHFQNEAKLVNWALTGKYEGVDRTTLGVGDLEMLAKLEERNTVLIGVCIPREERKMVLEKFVTDCRNAHSYPEVAA